MTARAHKIRLYPNKKQEELLNKTVGASRYVYNWCIDRCKEAYEKGEKHPSGYDLRKLWVAKHPDWADDVAASCLYKSCLNADAAYKAFFQKVAKHPTYHKKGIKDNFYVAGDKGRIINKKVRIPGIGYMRMSETLRYEDCKINSYVISKKAGKWYVSVQCDILEDVRTTYTSVVGVDVGIKNWAVASDGTVCETPKQLKHYERQLKRKQRLFSRKQKGSKRRAKAQIQVQKAYQKITNIKLDAIHKFTATIAKNHGTVVVEDLNVDDLRLSDKKAVRKGIRNSMMSELLWQLTYKCNNYIKVDKYYPSSKTCSNCGYVNNDLTLANRSYHCPSCGLTIDRDYNASLNLLSKGLEIISGGSHR